jgi:hypothetical protein
LAERLASVQQAMEPQQTKIVAFGGWLPDLPELGSEGSHNVSNVIPDVKGYRPFPGLVDQSSNALTAAALGAYAARDASNNAYVYAGDATKLYEMVALAWTDESKGGGYSTTSDDVWEFTTFGATVIATNFTDPVQSMAVGGGAAGAFADLITSTNKPKAKHLDVVRDFLVLGNTNDTTDGHMPNRVWFSAINDATDFDPSATTQSDYQDFPEGGWVQRVVGGTEYGLIFQDRQIVRMEYVGHPLIFQFFPVDRRRGTPIPNSVVGHGRRVFFISEEGFFEFNGSTSIPIGDSKVDRQFWAGFDIADAAKVSSAVDPVNKLVVWAVPINGSSINQLYIYNWASGRWANIEISLEIVLRAQTQGYTLEGLDALSANIDTGFTQSFDSAVWKGGQYSFGAMDTDHKLAFFEGSNLAASITTPENQLAQGRRSLVTAARPLVDGTGASAATVTYHNRVRQQDAVTSIGPAAINASGITTARSNGRYHSHTLDIPAGTDWDHALGMEITFTPEGTR